MKIRNKFSCFIFFMFVIIVSSCNQSYDKSFTEKFECYLNKNFDKKIIKKGLYIVLPEYACKGCSDAIIKHLNMKSHINDNIILILIKGSKTSFSDLSNYNVINDTPNFFSKEINYNSIYPYMIEIQNSKVISHDNIIMTKNIDKAYKLIDKYTL